MNEQEEAVIRRKDANVCEERHMREMKETDD